MAKKIRINCNEATTICDKSQYGEASFWDKIRLNMHLLLCKHCNAYSKQNKIMTKILGTYLSSCNAEKHLTAEEKKLLKNKLSEKID